jgi:16S rRNA (uracil1498-N3)-methyltransferase
MPVERFYVPDPLENGEVVTIQEEEFHHLSRVIRVRVKDSIELVNGMGSLAKAHVEELSKHHATARIYEVQKKQKPSHDCILALAIPKAMRLEYIAEKSVELGITKLWLFPGSLSEKKEISSSQERRLRAIFLSALKQCGRLFLPSLTFMPSILSWKESDIPPSSFFGDTDPKAPSFLSLLSLHQASSSFLFAIGPEGGFHTKELDYMKKNLHMQGVSLHKNILRVDTAAICALSLSSFFYSDS